MSNLQPYEHASYQPVPGHVQHPVPQTWSHAGGMVTDQRAVGGGVVAVAWVLAVVSVGYMLPWAIAASRGKANHGSIALLNALLGWSLIGWIAALVMACQAHQVVATSGPVNVVFAQQFPQAQFAGPVPPVSAGPPAGWYPAPDGVGRRYWDGATWTEHRAY